jgi:hypothetical protein
MALKPSVHAFNIVLTAFEKFCRRVFKQLNMEILES